MAMMQTKYRLALLLHFARTDGERVFDDPLNNYTQLFATFRRRKNTPSICTNTRKLQLKHRHKIG
jgi:hypothetical protein